MSIGHTQTVMDKFQDAEGGVRPLNDVSSKLEDALNSIALGNNASESTEPEITPMRSKSPPATPRKAIPLNGRQESPLAGTEGERGRQEAKGSVILSTTAAKRKKKEQGKNRRSCPRVEHRQRLHSGRFRRRRLGCFHQQPAGSITHSTAACFSRCQPWAETTLTGSQQLESTA